MGGARAQAGVVIDIVFLDAGETLLHPHPSFHELFAIICADAGVDVTAEDVEGVQRRMAPHLVDLAEDTGVDNPSLAGADSRRFWTYLYRRFLEELGIEDESLVTRLYERFSSSSSYRLFDDALPAMTELRGRGYRLGLISNFEQWLEEMLVELEVGDLFDVAVISGVEGVEKPDPGIYRLALDRAKVAPEATVHVGDSPGLDVQPAREVGMNVVLLDRHGRYRDERVARIDSLQELPDVVSKL